MKYLSRNFLLYLIFYSSVLYGSEKYDISGKIYGIPLEPRFSQASNDYRIYLLRKKSFFGKSQKNYQDKIKNKINDRTFQFKKIPEGVYQIQIWHDKECIYIHYPLVVIDEYRNDFELDIPSGVSNFEKYDIESDKNFFANRSYYIASSKYLTINYLQNDLKKKLKRKIDKIISKTESKIDSILLSKDKKIKKVGRRLDNDKYVQHLLLLDNPSPAEAGRLKMAYTYDVYDTILVNKNQKFSLWLNDFYIKQIEFKNGKHFRASGRKNNRNYSTNGLLKIKNLNYDKLLNPKFLVEIDSSHMMLNFSILRETYLSSAFKISKLIEELVGEEDFEVAFNKNPSTSNLRGEKPKLTLDHIESQRIKNVLINEEKMIQESLKKKEWKVAYKSNDFKIGIKQINNINNNLFIEIENLTLNDYKSVWFKVKGRYKNTKKSYKERMNFRKLSSLSKVKFDLLIDDKLENIKFEFLKSSFENESSTLKTEVKTKIAGERVNNYKSEKKVEIYEGDKKFDKRDGYGKMTYPNKDIYEGQWKNDLRHGVGKLSYLNGSVYEGTWENDKKHGKGTLKLKTGFKIEQKYQYGKIIFEKEKTSKQINKNHGKNKVEETKQRIKKKHEDFNTNSKQKVIYSSKDFEIKSLLQYQHGILLAIFEIENFTEANYKSVYFIVKGKDKENTYSYEKRVRFEDLNSFDKSISEVDLEKEIYNFECAFLKSTKN